MDAQTIDPDALVTRSMGGRGITCPLCGAVLNSRCTTSSGRPTRADHMVRYGTWAQRMRGEDYLVRVLADNDRLGVRAREVYLAESYRLDPGAKCSLLARLPDGYDPDCNQYWSDVEWLGFSKDVVPAS